MSATFEQTITTPLVTEPASLPTDFVFSYSKSKILQKRICEYVTFATVKFTMKIPFDTQDGVKKKKSRKVSRIENVVIKYYKNTKLGSKELINEITILDYINTHIHDKDLIVPQSIAYKIRKSGSKPHVHYIERKPGHDLEYWVNHIFSFVNHPTQAYQIIYKIAKAIRVLHNNKIAHKDIKPENILLHIETDEPEIIMIDFAFSKFVIDNNPTVQSAYCGTECYASPELSRQLQYNLFANDVWCFGSMLYALYNGHYLPGPYEDKITSHFESCRYAVNESNMPKYIKNILRRIFVAQEIRININAIIEMLDETPTCITGVDN